MSLNHLVTLMDGASLLCSSPDIYEYGPYIIDIYIQICKVI